MLLGKKRQLWRSCSRRVLYTHASCSAGVASVAEPRKTPLRPPGSSQAQGARLARQRGEFAKGRAQGDPDWVTFPENLSDPLWGLEGPASSQQCWSLCCPRPSARTILFDTHSCTWSKAVPVNPITVVWFNIIPPNVSSTSDTDIVTYLGGLAYLIQDVH